MMDILWKISKLFTSILLFIIIIISIDIRTCGKFLRPYKYVKNKPFVTIYENENFRGDMFNLVIGRKCTNLPSSYSKWASSFESHGRCVDICGEANCSGNCSRIEPNSGIIPRLHKIGFNDQIVSVKSCYVP